MLCYAIAAMQTTVGYTAFINHKTSQCHVQCRLQGRMQYPFERQTNTQKKAIEQAIEQERNHPISYTETKKRQNNAKENYKGLKSSSSEE